MQFLPRNAFRSSKEKSTKVVLPLWTLDALKHRAHFSLVLCVFCFSAARFMHPDAVPSPEWIPLEAPSGRIKDRMRVQVTNLLQHLS